MNFQVNGAVLKWTAFGSMLVDHTAAVLLEPVGRADPAAWQGGVSALYFIMRLFGRMAFPLFCFLLLEGMEHTGNPVRYGARLFALALVSEVPFDMAVSYVYLDFHYQNTIFTLFCGYVGLSVVRWAQARGRNGGSSALLMFVAVFGAVGAAELGHTDYGGVGVLFLMLLYIMLQPARMGGMARPKWLSYTVSLIPLVLASRTAAAAVAAAPLVQKYDGSRGRQGKYFFYIAYPAHLLLLVVVRYWLYR